MASKKDNIKALFSNTRSRIIIVFTLLLVVTTMVIGFIKFSKSTNLLGASSGVNSTPGGIQSIPGALNQTAQYASLQQQQNIEQAAAAQAKGSSAIPTIIRSQAFGQGVQSVGAVGGQGSVGFSTLAREDQSGPESTLWFQNLKDTQCDKDSIDKAVNEHNASMKDLKLACTCEQLKMAGYGLSDLKNICSCLELKSLGFIVTQFKSAGYSAETLRTCGFVACEEHAAGFTAQEMKDAGFSDGELKGAGFSDRDIARAGGLPDGVSIQDVQKAGCSVENLKRLRSAGVTAAAIRRISGCTADQLKNAGYSALELKNAGFSAAQLKDAGFSPEQLAAAGFGARDLMDAGFTPDQLAAAGFSQADLAAAEAMLPPGITGNAVATAGCTPEAIRQERLAGVSASMIKKLAHCSASQLMAGGFSTDDLLRAGFSPKDISAAPLAGLANLSTIDDATLKKMGCDPKNLKSLMVSGVSAKRIHDVNGCSLDALKAAGFSPEDVSNGTSAANILAAGRATGCSVETLKMAQAAGISAATIRRTLGCSAQALKAAGYSAAELKEAGFTAAELKNAGFAPAELKAAGFSAKDLRAAGFSAAELKAAGFSASELKAAEFSAADLKAAGFSADDLKAAGFSAAELKAAGFSADDLHKAGFSAKDLVDAGFSAIQLKNAGFSPDELIAAGISSKDSALAALESVSPLSTEPSNLAAVPPLPGGTANGAKQKATAAENAEHLKEILDRQQAMQVDQRFQQKIQQRTSLMTGAAGQVMQPWKTIPTQQYVAGSSKKGKDSESAAMGADGTPLSLSSFGGAGNQGALLGGEPIVRMGDILFAVIDTSVNSDEPGPILATIVSGKLKGGKLIGTFNLPANADKLVISFNSLSMPGAPKTISISAFAVDPNTARTALSSETDHHYLSRYGALFASTFLEGFGNAFQSANTTITVGGTGGNTNTTVQNGVGRSTLENAVIGLATVGKAWGQVAQQNMSRPTTIQVYSGTAVGVLFTQDLKAT